jgi:pterin-4a-carbinolamine dehydratase
MKRNAMKRLLCLVFAALLLLVGCQKQDGKDTYNQKAPDLTVPNPTLNDLSFNFDAATAQFTITDNRTGKVWSNGLTEEYYGQEIINKVHKKTMMALYSITYTDDNDSVSVLRNTDDDLTVQYVQEGNKVTAHSVAEEIGVSFDVIFELKANTLVVSVPADKIQENETYRLVTIELLPFLGASINSEDGYIFFPDGSGALYEFKEREVDSSAYYQMQVYGDYFYDYDDRIQDVETGVKTAMLPVFGIKQGNGAILAAVTKGQAETNLKLSPSGYIYDAARVSPIFNYRYSYEIKAVDSNDTVVMQEEKRSTSDFEVQYTFLANENANYNGMANTYRKFLIDNGLLNQSDYQTSVALDYLLSLQKPVMMWSQNVAASTFDDAVDTLTSLQEKGVSGIKMNLLGWQSKGYNVYPSHFPVSSVIGGAGGLENLIEQSKELNTLIALNDNFFLAQSNQDGYSKRADLAYSVKNEIYVDNDEVNFLMDFRSAKNLFTNDWMDEALDLSVEAVNLDDIARIVYANGSKSSPLRRTSAETVLSQMLQTASDNFSHVGVSGGNLYGLKYADFLYDIPESSSQDFLFDRDIPFFQMVVHGSIAYSPEVPGNFSNNYNLTLLKWAEYGFVPYFSVSESSATVLKDCYNEGVLISKFEDVEEKITDTVKQFDESFASLRNVAMVSHQVKDNGLVEVGYENGTVVLLNYSSQAVTDDDGTVVEAENFKVLSR